MVPDKAVITAKTEEEAQRLLDFLKENGYGWASRTDTTWWHEDREDTCYDLEPDKRIMHASHDWYQEQIVAMEAGEEPDDICWIPDDRSWLFISTDEFIARCTGEDDMDSNVDISALM